MTVNRGGWMPYMTRVPVVCAWEFCPDKGVVRKADGVLAMPSVGTGVVAMPPLHCASCGMQMVRQPYLTRDQQEAGVDVNGEPVWNPEMEGRR